MAAGALGRLACYRVSAACTFDAASALTSTVSGSLTRNSEARQGAVRSGRSHRTRTGQWRREYALGLWVTLAREQRDRRPFRQLAIYLDAAIDDFSGNDYHAPILTAAGLGFDSRPRHRTAGLQARRNSWRTRETSTCRRNLPLAAARRRVAADLLHEGDTSSSSMPSRSAWASP